MRLRIITPLDVITDTDGIAALRAEDETGSFGILPGHADFLTVLSLSVVAWKTTDGAPHFCAVRQGVLSVDGGTLVAIATREAVIGTDLATLDQSVLARFRADAEDERSEHAASTRLQLDAIRRMVSRLQPFRNGPGLSS